MEQAREVGLANQLRQLVVGAVVSGGQRRECGRVEARSLADCGYELPRSIDQKRAKRLGLAQKAREGFGYRSKVVLGERPICRAGGHRAPLKASPRCVSAFGRRAGGGSPLAPTPRTREGSVQYLQSVERVGTRARRRGGAGTC